MDIGEHSVTLVSVIIGLALTAYRMTLQVLR